MRNSSWSLLLQRLIAVAALLLAVEVGVRTVFLPRLIAARYPPTASLRAWPGGDNLPVLMEAIARRPQKQLVAMIGDSTMNTLDPNDVELPFFTQQELDRRSPASGLETVHGGIMGLYATEVALTANRYINNGADVVVWGVQTRGFPKHAANPNVTHIRWQMGPLDQWRLYRAGVGGWWLSMTSAEQILSGWASGVWDTYNLRGPLRTTVWDRLRPTLPLPWAQRLEAAVYKDEPFLLGPPLRRQSRFNLTWEDFGPNDHWVSIEAVAALCAKYIRSRCVLYAGAVNPAVRDTYVEPRLQAYLIEQLRAAGNRHGVTVVDLTDSLQPNEFRSPMFPGRRYDPIHPNDAGRRKLASLLAGPILDAAAR